MELHCRYGGFMQYQLLTGLLFETNRQIVITVR